MFGRVFAQRQIFIFLLINVLVTCTELFRNNNVKTPPLSIKPTSSDREEVHHVSNSLQKTPRYKRTASFINTDGNVGNQLTTTRQANPNAGSMVIFPNPITLIPDKMQAKLCREDPITSCNGTKNYPIAHIRKLYSLQKINEELFVSDILKASVPTDAGMEPKMSDSGDGNRKQFCTYIESVIYPEIGTNQAGLPRYIIQYSERNLTQGIRIEKCRQEGESDQCGTLRNSGSYASTTCVQKYSYRHLLILGTNADYAIREPIQIPSSCVCMYDDSIERSRKQI